MVRHVASTSRHSRPSACRRSTGRVSATPRASSSPNRSTVSSRSRYGLKFGVVSLRFNIQLLCQCTPVLLLVANELSGALRRAGSFSSQAEGYQPLMDFGAFEVLGDFSI